MFDWLLYHAPELTFPKGSKIRSTYVAFAQKEKKRLESDIANSEREIAAREKEVTRLKGTPFPSLYRRLTQLSTALLDHEESLSAAAIELRKTSRT